MELIKEIISKEAINNKDVAYKYLKEFGNQDKEFFIVLGLNTKNQPLYREIVHIGGLNSSIIDIRSIFKKAILMSCNSIIVAHNHPSQDLEPSREDLAITKKLIEARDILGIKVLDHLIINKDYFNSIINEV